jgi:hypothetical protein
MGVSRACGLPVYVAARCEIGGVGTCCAKWFRMSFLLLNEKAWGAIPLHGGKIYDTRFFSDNRFWYESASETVLYNAAMTTIME